VPYAMDTNDMKFWLAPALSPAQWFEYARDTFDWLCAESQQEGARMMSLGLHLRIIGRPGRIGALQRFFDHMKKRSDVWVTTRENIACAFANAVPAPGSSPRAS